MPNGEIPYKAAVGIWKKAPIGGEFAPSNDMEEMLGADFAQTLDLIRESHMTFIGPHTPLGYEKLLEETQTIKENLGYRYWISHMDVEMEYASQKFEVRLTWENDGTAPIYFPWMAMMYVYDKDGNRKYWEEIEIDLTELMPGESLCTVNHIPFNDLFREGYTIGIGILDPMTGEPSIELCMNQNYQNGINIIYLFDGKNGTTLGMD